MITISIAKKSDLKRIARLLFLAHKYDSQFDEEVVVSEKTLEEIEESVENGFKDPRLKYVLVKNNKEPVGIATIHLNSETYKSACVGELFVKEKYRKRGIGKRLMRKAITLAKENKAEVLKLTVAVLNKEAQQFYYHFGFNREKRKYLILKKDL